MSAKHTPGPWSVDEPWQVWAESAGAYVAITQVEEFETLPRDQIEANARLIAAAPTMYEALTLIANTDPVDAALGPQRAVRIARAAIGVARAAIAKAEAA